MALQTDLTGILKGVIWTSNGIGLVALFTGPESALYWSLVCHFTAFIATGMLALCLNRSWLAWSLGAFWVPFLVSIWLTFRPKNRPDMFTASDTCWYHMDRAVNPMMVVGVMFFDTPLKKDALQNLIEQRLLKFDRFKQIPRLVEGQRLWVEEKNFQLDHHVVFNPLTEPTEQAFSELVNTLSAAKLDFDKPLWQMHVINNHPQGAAIIIRIHHCIADGIALVRILLSLTDRDPAAVVDAVPRVRPPKVKTNPAVFFKELVAAFPRLLMLPDHKTSFKYPLTGERRTAWSAPLPLQRIKALAHAHGGKINDVVLAATAGALRRYFLLNNEPVNGITFRVLVPVNIRPLDGPIELGNKIGFIYLPLPVEEADPIVRLRKVKAAMDDIKGGKEAFLSYLSLCLIGTLPRALQHLTIDTFNKNASTTMTNVPGPREKLHFAGEAITNMLFFGPQSGKMGVGISVFSYQDTLTLGITADKGMVPFPERFTQCFEQELTEWPA